MPASPTAERYDTDPATPPTTRISAALATITSVAASLARQGETEVARNLIEAVTTIRQASCAHDRGQRRHITMTDTYDACASCGARTTRPRP